MTYLLVDLERTVYSVHQSWTDHVQRNPVPLQRRALTNLSFAQIQARKVWSIGMRSFCNLLMGSIHNLRQKLF